MKKLFTLLAFVVTMTAMAQSVAISDDGSVADGSAILEVKSTTKGFLLPRMTAEQRDAIVEPVTGLQIWCTDCGPTGAIEVYTGDGWSNETALITGLQAQLEDLQAQIDAMGSGTGGGDLSSVTIGDQEWTTKNLDVATYRGGTAIPEVTDATEWENLKTGAWCYYENDSENGTTYGKLYNWYAVMGITTEEDASPTEEQIAARKQFAPTGWHVPSNDEWATLIDDLGGKSIAGGKIKETGIAHWSSPNQAATNSSGFTALPGGYRSSGGTFYDSGSFGGWWSSTTNSIRTTWLTYLESYNDFVNIDYDDKTRGHSVRCLRD